MTFVSNISNFLGYELYHFKGFLVTIIVFAAIFCLVQCYFGYKIFRAMLVVQGVLSGLGIGALIGFGISLNSIQNAILFIILFAVIGGVVGGILAHALYKFGVFMYFFTMFGVIISLITILSTKKFVIALIAGAIVGIIAGILGVIFDRFIIIGTTSICNGVISGLLFGSISVMWLGIVLALIFAVTGFIVQLKMSKKSRKKVANNNGVQTYQPNFVQSSTNVPVQPSMNIPVQPSMNVNAQPMFSNSYVGNTTPNKQNYVSNTYNDQNEVYKRMIASQNLDKDSLLKRAFIFVEDGDFENANLYSEMVLDKDPECAEAYLCKLLSELKVRSKNELANLEYLFNNSEYYNKLMRFGSEELCSEIKGYIDAISEKIYQNAIQLMNVADSEQQFISAINMFNSINNYKNSNELACECQKRIEPYSFADPIYNQAIKYINCVQPWEPLFIQSSYYREAVKLLSKINGWRDSNNRLEECRAGIERVYLKQQERKKGRKTRILIASISIVAVFSIVMTPVLLSNYIVPISKYNSAVSLMYNGKYEEAAMKFNSMSYRDSNSKFHECVDGLAKIGKYDKAIEIANKYNFSKDKIEEYKYLGAISLINNGNYTQALELLSSFNANYKDCEDLKKECNYCIAKQKLENKQYDDAKQLFNALYNNYNYKDSFDMVYECDYQYAIELYEQGKNDEAIKVFEKLNDDEYKDSADYIQKCKDSKSDIIYNKAMQLLKESKFEEAKEQFISLNGYRDSNDKITECDNGIKEKQYQTAEEYFNSGKYEEAKSIFQGLGEYKDSKKRVAICGQKMTESQNKSTYDQAMEYYNNKQYHRATESFISLGDYKDSESMADKAMQAQFESAKIKSNVYFGNHYWTVINKSDSKLTLLANKCLDFNCFNNKNDGTVWKDSDIREYLNNTFLNTFSEKENNDGTYTHDKIYLLSKEEANNLPSFVAPADARWWLRDRALVGTMYVDEDGTIYDWGNFSNILMGIRPALQIQY